MHEQAAKTLIKDTFQQPYDLGRFREFIRNLMKGYEERHTSSQIPDNFKDSITSMYRVGKVRDDAGNEIELLAVTLTKETSLDRARTMQRNFIARHLSVRDKEAALVAFVSPDSDSWRFSLVRRELSLTRNLKGKTKAVQDFSPARRFSFLVGKNERTHTAQRQLIELLRSDNRPSLKILEKAFNIERVTEEFFEEYRELFNRVHDVIKAYVDQHPATKVHFAEKDIDPADFAKRLLGQIVFLYFLQKKGWLGVPTGKKWGEGSRTFLRDIYDQAESTNQNFFHEYLQPLFYDALNRDHSDNKHYHKLFDSRIPFLNGGLFEPYHNYDWTEQDIKLPNSLFHELGSSLFGDDGKGILNVFDRYNFTVAEDEPLEREVAIDPEMLGKVFEKLLPVKERGRLGTFYTPREIVHYMCQESLIAYLSSHFPALDKTDLDDFIRYGDLLMEHDSKILRDGASETYKDFFLGATIRANLKAIDEALKTVKVCDPAIGSGAFPVGMMSEIVRARKVLAAHMRQDRQNYDLKRETIQESLYGVDFDPGAIEIAKLRLWLSLVVDEDNFDEIQALPNLDYKIMQGNSLLQSYEGIKLFEDTLLKQHDHTIRRKAQLQSELKSLETTYKTLQDNSSFAMSPAQKKGLLKEIKQKKKQITALEEAKTQEDMPSLLPKVSEAVELAERLKNLHHEFFDADRPKKKKELKAEIETLEWQLIETSLREKNKADKIPDIQKLQRHNVKPYFLWKLHFNEVFTGDNGGFDIVIANPPYINSKENTDFSDAYRETFLSAYGSYDVYILFMELSLNVINSNGHINFITSNKWLIADYAMKLRKIILEQFTLSEVDDLADCKRVFKSALVSPAITIINREKPSPDAMLKFRRLKDDDAQNIAATKSHLASIEDFKLAKSFQINVVESSSDSDLLNKMCAGVRKLRDIAEVRTGIMGFEYWNFDPYISEGARTGSIRIATNGFIEPFAFKWGKKVKLFKKDIYNPYLDMQAPNISDNTLTLFRAKKVVIRGVAKKLSAVYDDEGVGLLVAVHCVHKIVPEINPHAIVAILNSELMNWYHLKTYYTARIPEGSLKYPVSFLEDIPIGEDGALLESIAQIASQIADQKKQNPDADVSALEAAINAEVYKLYNLTEAEIAIIEQAVP